MRRLLIIGLLLCLAGVVTAQNAVSVASPAVSRGDAPKIKFTTLKYDFGDVDEGGDVTHLFRFRNTGRGTLKITGVNASCGCTGANASRDEIAPGESGAIRVAYHTVGRPGKTVKTVTVTSNDPATPSVTLTFNVNVVREIDIQPDRAYFFGVRKGQSRSVTVTVLGKKYKPFKILSAESRNKKVSVTLTPLDQEGRHGGSLWVVLPPESQIGDIADEVVLKTNDVKKPEIVVPVQGEVLGRVQVIPKQVYMGAMTQPITLSILADPADGFAVRSVSTEKRLAKPWVQKQRTPDGRDQYQLVVSPPNIKNLPVGEYKDVLHLYTNDAEQSDIAVPVTGQKNP